ncbi:MAG: hypothetical protein JXQ83_07050, partial [Candidatus Glassbacteria bacterium]|nr:hypothetical protein [Candidatus Glassbacteria bacterium]
MTRKNDLVWPRALLLLWIWLSAAVIVAGRPASLWGLLPVGPAEGFWALLVALILTVLVFGTQADLLDRLDSQTASFGLERPHTSRFLSLYAILFLLAWVFRSENHFLGDGYLVSLELVKPFHLFSTAPLNFFILQSFNRLLRALGAVSGETAYALLHCLAFPFFLWFCRRTSCLLCSAAPERNALFLLTAGTGSLQLFFGYVENYTLLHLWLVVYLYLSLRFLAVDGKNRAPWGPTLAFLVAAAGHRSGVVLLPSLVYLWLQHFPPGPISKKPAGRSLLTAACALACLALSLLLLDNGPMVPPFNGRGDAEP